MGTILFMIALCVEIGFCVWAFAVKQRHQKEKEVVRLTGLLLLILLVLMGVLQGFVRYGAFIFILALQLLLGGIKIIKHKDKPIQKGKMVIASIGSLFLYLFCLAPAFLFPQYTEPLVTGTHQVAIKEYTWVDDGRVETYTNTGEDRELTVKFFYPEEEGTYPLVVFSHGAFGVIDSNFSTCKELASNGYVVVSIGHTYHAMYLKNVKGKVFLANAEFMNSVMEENGTRDPEGEAIVYGNSKVWMDIRCKDENFVLDTILEKVAQEEGGPFSLINPEKIGLFGHSMGGATSAQVGRERDDIDAVVDLEGTMFGEYVDFQNGTEVFNEEPYTVPILDVNSGDIDRQARELPGQGYVNFYVGEHATDYHYQVVEGAGHLNFTDLPLVSPFLAKMLGTGDIDARECIESTNQMILDFFNNYLK
ncbi:MAG TPA: dienelactone hydrolase family protein [Lachnospiraceae bacterium]|nr:dienelactone hydrolase family protein [Lachnospiraceae bacterium]